MSAPASPPAAKGQTASARISLQAPASSQRPVLSAPMLGLAWLVRLRWIAAAFQFVVLAAALLYFQAPSSPGAVAALIGVTATTNLALFIWLRRGGTSAPWLLGAVLLLDTSVLTAMLYLSGGPSNPFTVFYLVHVALAALLLDTKGALLLSLVTSACFAGLFLVAPAHDAHAHHGADFSSHLQGMWISYTLAACFVGYFVAKMSRALQRRERELARLGKVAARAEKLASLSTLAAGAAHELGTPIGTIAIVAKELERLSEDQLDAAAIRDDARLLRGEAERCRQILDRMANDAGQSMGERPIRLSADELLQRLEAELGPEIQGRLEIQRPEGAEAANLVVLAPPRALVQALANLIRNGADAAAGAADERVRLELLHLEDSASIQFRISDRGVGIPPEDLVRLGEPFFSTKAPGQGLGLGLFLVRELAQRCGGTVEVESARGVGSTFLLNLPAAA